MSEIALKLAKLSPDDLKSLAGSLGIGLTNNPTLVPTPAVTPAQLTAAAKDVTDQEVILKAAEDNVVTQVGVLAQKLSTLKALMTLSAEDSAVAVEHEGPKMTLLNIPLKGAAGSSPAPTGAAPQNFSVTQGDHTGEADGHCNPVRGASLYRAQSAPASGGPWTTGYEGRRTRFTIGGFTPGQEVWFQMAAFVNGQWTDWSDPAKCRII